MTMPLIAKLGVAWIPGRFHSFAEIFPTMAVDADDPPAGETLFENIDPHADRKRKRAGGGSRFGTPVLVMRETTERPEGVAAGMARLVGTDPDRIVAETEQLLDDSAACVAMARAHDPFGDGRSAAQIADLLTM